MLFIRLFTVSCIVSALLACTKQQNEQQAESSTIASSTQVYFEKLKSERVESDPIVKWQNIGPGMSGYNEELWTHPTNPDVMFIAPDMHVAYGTWDGGESWQSIQDHDELGQEMKRVIDIEFSQQDPNYAVALDWNGWIYESLDQGKSWHKLSELSPSYEQYGVDPYDPLAFKKGWYDEQIGMRLSDIAIDPNNDSIWYVGAGDYWNVKENHRSMKKPHGNTLSYADYGYILKSENKGRSWKKIDKDFPENLDVGEIIVNPKNSKHIVMLTNYGLMHSKDAGENWLTQAEGLPHNSPRDITYYFDESSGEHIFYLIEQTHYIPDGSSIKSSGGIYSSADFGESWQNITGNLAFDLSQVNYPAEHWRYFRAIGHWLGIGSNKAKEQYPTLPKSILPVFNRIAVNPLDKNEIYVSYNKKHDRTFLPGEAWQSLDGGQTWKVVARHGKYWLSDQDKAYWDARENPSHANVEFSHVQAYMDAHAEKEGNRLLEFNSKGEVFLSIAQQTHKSSDKGKTWQQIDDIETSPGSGIWIGRGNSDLPGRFMLLDTGIPKRRLLTSGEHGVWETVPMTILDNPQAVALKQIEGQAQVDGMYSISTMAVHPDDPDTLYIMAWRQAHKGKLRRSTDGGKSWQNISTVMETSSERNSADGKVIQGPPGMLPASNSLLIDPTNPNTLFFVNERDAFSEIYRAPRREPTKGGYGFMKSVDGGLNWKVSNTGFHENASLRRLAIDPENPNVIYAAAADKNGGLYKTEDQGDTWQRIAIPDPIKSVNNIYIDKQSHELFISAGGFYDGAYEEGGAWRSKDGGETWQKFFSAPLVLQVETSPVNPKIILLTAGNQMRMDRQFMNPGLYLSLDDGSTWKKINTHLANSDKIIDAKPDPENPDLLWAAGWGSGWYVGYINGANGKPWYQY
ncbi:VPS10 domain-containing protein [Agaribacter flavus]|uniref:Sortilin N-terminal domain-containing protein n=1 Tax=Agaribacter flavus TaxID=1902781 RepID=A0ABV7FWB1_9ALTE